MHIKDGGTWKEVQSGQIRDGGVWKEFHAPQVGGGLPAGWNEILFGNGLYHPTGTEYDSNTGIWTWRGGGDDFWSSDDNGYFVYTTMEDNQTAVLHLQTMIDEASGDESGIERYALVDLMCRADLNTNSEHWTVGSAPNPQKWYQRRRLVPSGNTLRSQIDPADAVPGYFRVVRSAGNITTDYSTDGVNWVNIGNSGSGKTGTWYIGIAIAAKDIVTPKYLIATGTITIT